MWLQGRVMVLYTLLWSKNFLTQTSRTQVITPDFGSKNQTLENIITTTHTPQLLCYFYLMASKVSNFSDLIHRVAASCLLHPLAQAHESGYNSEDNHEEEETEEKEHSQEEETNIENGFRVSAEENKMKVGLDRIREMEEALMVEVFESVSVMKKAYISLQEAHNPWDLEKMTAADVTVVAELKKLGMLRERFRRRCRGSREGSRRGGFAPLSETVAPYEAAMEELKRDVKVKEIEVENLKEKLRIITINGKKGKFPPKRRLNHQVAVAAAPAPELFEATMNQVKEASKSFTSHLLSLMRASHWDISAAVRSIEAATNTPTTTNETLIGPHQAKYALESYICRKIFQGFDHETFYIDGSLSSLLQPDQFRRDCFNQFRDMKGLEPAELLGILPTCHFGKFCCKKFLSIVHPKMEESLFGDLDHHNLVSTGNHPRSQFYGEFLCLAKAVWLLHLLAFALDPSPCHFEATKGTEFNAEYMESVIRLSGGGGGGGGRVPVGQIVGFPVSPGFKLSNNSVIKARVYLVSRT